MNNHNYYYYIKAQKEVAEMSVGESFVYKYLVVFLFILGLTSQLLALNALSLKTIFIVFQI